MGAQQDLATSVDLTGYYLRGVSGYLTLDSGAGLTPFTNNGVVNAAGRVDSAGFSFDRSLPARLQTASARCKFTEVDAITAWANIQVPSVAAGTPWGIMGSFFGGTAGAAIAAYDPSSYGLFARAYANSGFVTAGNNSPPTILSDATWYFVLMSLDPGSGVINLEIDNTTFFTSSSYLPGGLSQSGDDWFLGCIDSSLDWPFNGLQSECGLVRRLLTSGEKALLAPGKNIMDDRKFRCLFEVFAAPGSTGGSTAARDSTGARLIIISLAWYSVFQTHVLPTDSYGNVWLPLTEQTEPFTSIPTRLFYCINPTVGSGHTFSNSTGSNPTFGTIHVRGYDTINPSDVIQFESENGSNAGAGSTSIQPGAVTPSQDGCLLVSSASAGSAPQTFSSIDSGFLATPQDGVTGVNVPLWAGVRLLGAGTAGVAVNPTWNIGGSSGELVATIACFRAVSSAPAFKFARPQRRSFIR